MEGLSMKTNYEKIFAQEDIPAMIKVLDQRELKDISVPIEIAPHWHRSLELTYVRKGEVNLWINNHQQIIKEKEFILVNSGQIHRLTTQDPQNCETVIVIISYQFLKENCPNIENVYFNINKTDEHKEHLREIYENLRMLDLHPSPYNYLMSTAYIYEILYILLNDYQEAVDVKHYQMSLKKHDILDYIEDHYQEELSLKNISETFYMSEEHFSRTFHEYFGINFKTYLTKYRLYCSFQDVAQSDKNIQDIAFEHGFSNVKAFITTFKKNYGLTPYQFRKKNHISKNDNLIIK